VTAEGPLLSTSQGRPERMVWHGFRRLGRKIFVFTFSPQLRARENPALSSDKTSFSNFRPLDALKRPRCTKS